MICAGMLSRKIRDLFRPRSFPNPRPSRKKDRLRFGAACLFYYSIWQQGKVRCLALESVQRERWLELGLRQRPVSGLPPVSELPPGLGLGSLLLPETAKEKLSGTGAQRLFRDDDDGVRACAFQVGRRFRLSHRFFSHLYQRSVRWLARHASLSGQPLSPPVRPPGRRLQMLGRRFRRGLMRIVSY